MTFASPILLIGLIAAGIPLLLHLISRVRAQQELFPTLRFLKLSMDKTARRRRIENWLLLLLRSGLFGLLAVAVAQPITKIAGAWWGGAQQVSMILLDNSYSMDTAVNRRGATRFDLAKNDAESLLSGDAKPSMAAILTTVDKSASDYELLTTRLDVLRKQLAAVKTQTTPAVLQQRFVDAIELLNPKHNPQCAVYIFSDLQQLSFNALEQLKDFDIGGAHVFVVDYSRDDVNNVGVAGLKIKNSPIVGKRMEFVATIVNSSSSPRHVEVRFRVDGDDDAQRAIVELDPAGQTDASKNISFYKAFEQKGIVSGAVELGEVDDLMIDNTRKFRIEIGAPVRALVVSSMVVSDHLRSGDPGAMLKIALDWRRKNQQQIPWPIRVDSAVPDAITPALLKKYDAVFLCEVPVFADSAAAALSQYVRDGGVAMFFLGGDVQSDNYNSMFHSADGLLPVAIGFAVGQVGAAAGAQKATINIESPYFAGLFDNVSDYGGVLVQRYFVLPKISDDVARVDVRLADGGALLMERKLGRGVVVWCATGCSGGWSNFPRTNLFLPMVMRVALSSRGETDGIKNLAANPFGPECNLTRVDAEKLKKSLEDRGAMRVYVGKNLEDVTSQAAVDAQGKNWWSLAAAIVILMLVAEGLVAARRRA